MQQSFAEAALLPPKELQHEKRRKRGARSSPWLQHLPHAAKPKSRRRCWLWPWKLRVSVQGLPGFVQLCPSILAGDLPADL